MKRRRPKVDLTKLKEVIQRVVTYPINEKGSFNWQLGDIMIDINRMVKQKKLDPIYVYENGSESTRERIDFRESVEGGRQIPIFIIFPYEWVEGLEKEENKKIAS
jgi:hypothetical protein